MIKKAQEILEKLTLEEKAGLCSGADFWHLKSVERLGLTEIMVTDGPHGLRKQAGDSDHVGLNKSVAATCFPTASASASSWDKTLMFEMGQALAEECLQEDVAVILGPGANIKRSPLCGRNFEYVSEDPYHTGHMTAALINGVQSKGIGTSLKHFVMNNQEARRMTIDAVVDERAQREIYLTGFEIAVKEAQPWTVMCSYNQVDGTFLSDHKRLLTDILKEEWGHTGLVVTDWGACNDRVKGIQAGMELEMPSSGGRNDEKIVKAVNDGTLSENTLDKAVIRIIELILKSQDSRKKDFKYDVDKHHLLAKKVAANSSVLLKNNHVLPLTKEMKIAVIGEFAKSPRYQGAGSSIINPHKIDNACDVLSEKGINYSYAQGYSIKNTKSNQELIDDAVKTAKESEVVIIFAGLTDDYESEGYDRKHLDLPHGHTELIKQVAKANSNVVVVLQNGSPVVMPWLDDVKGVLECYLHGQAGAGAVIDILYGDVNPSGKLAETFPIALEDNSSYNYFPGSTLTVEHRESIFVGYRYYDTANKKVLFPFGYGLSYTEFSYSDLKIEKISELEYDISVTVKNIGRMAGSEIVQLYIKNNESEIFKANKELRAFDKVYLEPDEEKQITFSLNKRSFAYYNTTISDWHVDSGLYDVQIGSSSRDIRLSEGLTIEMNDGVSVPNYKEIAPAYYKLTNDVYEVDEKQFEMLYGKKLPKRDKKKGDPYTELSTMIEVREKFVGRLLFNKVKKQAMAMVESDDSEVEEGNLAMLEAIIEEMPLRSLGMMGGDNLPKYFVDGLILILNGKPFKGIGMIRKK
ncbi:MAG: glycoside hydrolase family 3 C-terminal domain-containing protein [Clostridiales bacterium]|nr:glycoside hydrolase family 3 C-terminal domain-containing protein [Clostridiales bacterium]